MKRLLAAFLTGTVILAATACSAGETVSEGSAVPSPETAVTTASGKPKKTTKKARTTKTGKATSSSASSKVRKTTDTAKTTKTTKTTATAKTQPDYEKPWKEHVSVPGDPTASGYDDAAAAIRQRVRSTRGSVRVTGTTWYVSPSGDDHNNGRSKEKAWRSLNGIVQHQTNIRSGDAVLFECGGVYRYGGGYVYLKSGVYYGAYGVGEKPCVYGSAQNYADATWTDRGDGTWMLEKAFSSDIGNLIFDHGAHVGYKRDSVEELKNDYDFCVGHTTKRVILKLSKNPATAFKDIEIPSQGAFFYMNATEGNVNHDVMVEDLVIKYAGDGITSHGDLNGLTVRNCEFGYLGGPYLSGFGDGKTRAGNGVTVLGNPSNVLIENCWFYQIYDSGVSFQGFGTVDGYTVRNCLMEYCGMGAFEYWGSTVKKAELSGNLMRFSGWGFGGQQRADKNSRAAIQSNGKATGAATNKVAGTFVIKDNIFDQSAYQLINATSLQNELPVFSGNTYVQKKGGTLGYYKTATNIKFDDAVLSAIQESVGDATATVEFR